MALAGRGPTTQLSSPFDLADSCREVETCITTLCRTNCWTHGWRKGEGGGGGGICERGGGFTSEIGGASMQAMIAVSALCQLV